MFYKKYIKIFLLFCFCLFSFIQECYAIEEDSAIELKIEQEALIDKILEPDIKSNSKKRKFSEPTGSAFDLFRSSGYTFESGPIKNQKFRSFLHGGILMNAQVHEDFSSTSAVVANEIHSETLFADNKTKLLIAYNLSKKSNYRNNMFIQRFTSLNISHAFNEHQTIIIGEDRVPIGYEGGISSSAIKMFSRSQIARNLGNYYSTGIKNLGDYKYGNYNIGFYDGSRSFNNSFDGYEVSAIASFKPLAKFDGKYGNLKIGGSIDNGNSANSYTVVGGHAIYNYNKFYADFEYLYANGLSGFYYGQGRAHGLYSTLGYSINPKLEILGRYDFYQNLNNHNISQEYSAGVNYYFNPKVKLMLQYILATNDNQKNPSHKIYIGTDFTSSSLLDLF